jgi:uncharacterized membrane protein
VIFDAYKSKTKTYLNPTNDLLTLISLRLHIMQSATICSTSSVDDRGRIWSAVVTNQHRVVISPNSNLVYSICSWNSTSFVTKRRSS